MYICIYGARERVEARDIDLVNKLLTTLNQIYGSALVIVTAATDKGVGCFVKDRCLRDKDKFKLVDVSTRIFGEMPAARMAQVFKCRNATIAELCMKFYIFDTATGKGITEDLITRAQNAELPVFVFKPGDIEPIKLPPKFKAPIPVEDAATASKPNQSTTEHWLAAQNRDV